MKPVRRIHVNEKQRQTLLAEEICCLAHRCAARGWVPATAGNFSFREAVDGDTLGRIWISASGLDKGAMTPGDLLEIALMETAAGFRVVQAAEGARPSAETSLHAVIYRDRPEARAIAHVHSVWNTLLSERCMKTGSAPGAVVLSGYELLKALDGVVTHEHQEQVPILENSQDYVALAAKLSETLARFPAAHGVLLSRHGLYTWGKSIAEARRHVEALEFLFEAEARRQMAGW
jgi:methylthioribulose-1-phosphate dehydratase